jgi:hypothetical protein
MPKLFVRRVARGSRGTPLRACIARRIALRVSIVVAAPTVPHPSVCAMAMDFLWQN